MNEPKAPWNPPPEVVEAFESAAITTIRELTQFEAISEASPDLAATLLSVGGIVASVRLVRTVPGLLTLALGTETASRLTARYLPAGAPLTKELIDDVAGEFANVIAGQAKTVLKGTPYHFTMSTPVVTSMPSFSLPTVVAESTLVISLATDVGRVLMCVTIPPCPGA